MGALGYGLDKATETAVTVSGYMLLPCMVFPPVVPLSREMPQAQGGPGSMLEGSLHWLDGSRALRQAQTAISSTALAISADTWSGADRVLFDRSVSELVQQLDTAATYSEIVGAGLAGLSAPLLAVGPACLAMAGILLAEFSTFAAAVASVVGNLGASEAAYAAGCATAASCLAVMTGITLGIAAVMSAAAVSLAIGTGVDVNSQKQHGDTSAADNYVKAQVDGLKDVAEGVLDLAVQAGAGALAGKATAGLPPARTLSEYIFKDQVEGGIGDRIEDVYDAGKDLVEGEGPGEALKDLSGYGDEIDAVEDLFGDDDQPAPQTDRYSLPETPQTPPPPAHQPPPFFPPYDQQPHQPRVEPLPPAYPGGPHVEPIPLSPADEQDLQVIPVGTDINDGVRQS